MTRDHFSTEEAEGSTLAGSRCRDCDRTFFPVKDFCPACLKTEPLEVIGLSRSGTLYSFTVAHTGPAGFDPPYALGYVDLPEGLRIFSMLVDCEPFEERLRIGQQMELVRVGDEYRFRPVGK
jgi:uncharacterized OB-fold protein